MYKSNVGLNAGVIWHLLEKKGALTLTELKEYIEFNSDFVLMSLGWLSREDKIDFFDDNGIVKVTLKHDPPEMYY